MISLLMMIGASNEQSFGASNDAAHVGADALVA
jgi:hypothetical protein